MRQNCIPVVNRPYMRLQKRRHLNTVVFALFVFSVFCHVTRSDVNRRIIGEKPLEPREELVRLGVLVLNINQPARAKN